MNKTETEKTNKTAVEKTNKTAAGKTNKTAVGKIAYALPIIAGILFGSVGVFVRILYGNGFDNPTVLFARAVLAAAVLFVYILIKNPKLLKIGMKDVPWILGCGIPSMLTTNFCFNISSTNLSLAFAAVLLSIAPVYTLVISRIVFKNRITPVKIICVAMTIAGCILVSGVIGSKVCLSLAGIVAGIISGISYGLYSIFSKKGTEGGLNALTITFYCMVIMAVSTAPFTGFHALAGYVCEAPLTHMMFLVLHALCIGVFPYLLLTLSVKHLSPGTVTILASCEPVAAMIFGVIFFSEVPTILALIGLAVTVVALGLLCRSE